MSFKEHDHVPERAKRSPEAIWVAGKDIAICETQSIPPGGVRAVRVSYPEGSLPPAMSPKEFLKKQKKLGITTRSRLAQGFNEVAKLTMKHGKPIAYINNYSQRASVLVEGQGIAQVYEQDKPALESDSLFLAIVKGDIVVGESADTMRESYGETWKYFGANNELLDIEEYANAKGIAVALIPKRWHIPALPEPVNVFKNDDFRTYLEQKVFQRLAPGETSNAVIAESVPIFLRGHHTLIDKNVTDTVRHLGSLLFEGSREKYQAMNKRYELVGEGASEVKYVRLRVHPATVDYKRAE